MSSENKLPDDEPVSPEAKRAGQFSSQFATAMELPFVLVGAVLLGGLLGYFLDRWLHTQPILLLVLGALGFFAGVRDVLRRTSSGDDGSAEK